MESDYIYINFDEIYVNDLNVGLSMPDIDQLAESIQQVGLQQPLLVLQDENGKYRLISGHRRYRAIEKLIKESKWKGKVECKEIDLEEIQIDVSDRTKELYMLLSGNINRDKTANDRFFEMIGWQEIYDELKRNKVKTFVGINGVEYELKKGRDYISKMTGMSSGDLARLKKIKNHAIEEVIDNLIKGNLSVNLAAEISSLSDDQQRQQLKKVKKEQQLTDQPDDLPESYINLKVFNQDIKTLKSKIKNSVSLSENDYQHYKKCIQELKELFEKQ